MKKIAKYLVLAFVLFLPFIVGVNAAEKSKINIYFFRGEGCPHCAEAEEWFKKLDKDSEYSKYYKIVDYEVWNNQDNADLMEKVAKELGTTAEGVPFIVIGDKYFSGFSQDSADEIKAAIKTAYNDKNYTDVMDKMKNEKKEQKSYLVPILIASGVAILAVIAMVFLTKEK